MDENKVIIRELIKIRINDYKISSDNVLYHADNFKNLIILIQEIIEKIIQANSKQNTPKQFELAKKSLTFLAKEQREKFILFSSQLIQYYTILCDVELVNQKTFDQALHYIQSKSALYGDTTNNLLILEYFTIKIYNETHSSQLKFESADDAEKSGIKRWLDYDRKKMMNFLADSIGRLKEFTSVLPQSSFINYLFVILNYTKVFLIEFEFILYTEKYLENFPKPLFDKQNLHLQEIKESLALLEKNKEEFSILEPFFMGNDILSKFPIKTSSEFREHLKELEDIQQSET